jgi:hypothetical protein
MTSNWARDRLITLIQRDALQLGTFQLASGRTSNYRTWALARECHGALVPVDETLFFGL